MSSGVSVSQKCLEEYQILKLKKKIKYIIFGLSTDLTEIIVHKTSEEKDYDKFLEDLPEDKCRWAIYDFEFEKEGEGLRNKIVFVSWSPDQASRKERMVSASSRSALKNSLTGISVDVQGTDYSEVAYESVLEKANRGH